LRKVVLEKLDRLGYSLPDEPPSEEAKKRLDAIMEKLDEDCSKWLLVASRRPSLLQELSTLVPVTYALTHKRAVHNISAEGLFDLYIKGDEENVCPLGRYALACANLVWFDRFGRNYRDLAKLESALGRLFCEWAEPGTQVVLATPYFGKWTKRDAAAIFKLYGMEAALLLNERVDVMDIG